MTKMKFIIIQLSFLALTVLSLAGCGKEPPAAQQEVVIYTSLDKGKLKMPEGLLKRPALSPLIPSRVSQTHSVSNKAKRVLLYL